MMKWEVRSTGSDDHKVATDRVRE